MFQKITKNWFNFLFLLAAYALGSTVEVLAAPSMVCSHGSNLIINGEAEADQNLVGDGLDADVSGWNPETGEFTIVRYTFGNGFPTVSDPGPVKRGNFLFSGGVVASSSGSQIINVADCATQIDRGDESFNLSGFLGGYYVQNDNARLTVTFRDAFNRELGTTTIGPVLAADRNNVTALLSRSTNGIVPVGTRTVKIVLLMTRTEGEYNDGYADNLSFVLTSPTETSVTIGGRVMTAQGRGISGARVSVTYPNGETRVIATDRNGFYRFTKVPVGQTHIFSVSNNRSYQFTEPTQVHFVTEERHDINFTALPNF